MPLASRRPRHRRAFLIRELANTLGRGTAGEIAAVSGYVSSEEEDLSGDLMPLLEPVVGDDRQQWARIAACLDAAMGIPRPAVADLFSAKSAVMVPAGPYRGILPILRRRCENCSHLPQRMNC